MSKNALICFIASLTIRFGISIYSTWMDELSAVKYTDIDYVVFTDAAKFVCLEGDSPYKRMTYRYTPLLALLMCPCYWIHMVWGKLLFSLLDVWMGYLVYRMMGFVENRLVYVCGWILFNPIMINVSTRGNADQIVVFLVVLTIYWFRQGKFFWSAVVYGFAIHWKIYPIVYYPVFHLAMGKTLCPSLSFFHWKRWFHVKQWIFGLTIAGVLFLLTLSLYVAYGYEFLYESYIYHFIRTDNRHNFSLYFYYIYLSGSMPKSILSVAMFIPQFLILLWIAFVYYQDLFLAIFLQTMIFVAYNKVCTVQYFVWWMPLLAFISPNLKQSILPWIGVWGVAQGIWLFWAFQLEFRAENTFIQIWGSSILFFLSNIAIALVVISQYDHKKTKEKKEKMN